MSSSVHVGEGRRPGPVAADIVWRTSSFSAETQCVEVAMSEDVVLVRNSTDRTRPFLAFRPSVWNAFTAAVRGGRFR